MESNKEKKVSPKAGNTATGEEDRITLKVKNSQGYEIMFKVKRTTKFAKLIDSYCERTGVQPSQCRFLFDGQVLKRDDSPLSQDMEDGDEIDVMVEQVGGSHLKIY